MMPATSQDKKELSRARDWRTIHGENDKASRKAVPLRKRLVDKATGSSL